MRGSVAAAGFAPLFAAGFLAACGASAHKPKPDVLTVTQAGRIETGTIVCTGGVRTIRKRKYPHSECGVTFPIVTGK
jgi:ferredoxin-like protein FixX